MSVQDKIDAMGVLWGDYLVNISLNNYTVFVTVGVST